MTLHSRNSQSGFTLLEIIVVLGLIAAIASVIVPNLGMTADSQMARALRNLSATFRATYDRAVLESRLHRVVIQPKKGFYWAEVGPSGPFTRPPLDVADTYASSALKADDRLKFLEDLEHEAKEVRKAGSNGEREYSKRSILVQQRNQLKPLHWSEIDDSDLRKSALPGSVVFASVQTEFMADKVNFTGSTDETNVYLYFFPSGETLQAAVQIGMIAASGTDVADSGPRFTLELDPVTGQSKLLEGFQEADFVKTQQAR
jgi:prepilin-type N-terminal cleavage/methylation domain-containing protein